MAPVIDIIPNEKRPACFSYLQDGEMDSEARREHIRRSSQWRAGWRRRARGYKTD